MINVLDTDQSLCRQDGTLASEAAVGTALVDARVIPELQRQQKLLDLYLFVIDSCLRRGVAGWWRRAVSLPFTDMTQGVAQLKELCFQDLLCDGGDIAGFCRAYEIMEQEGHLADDGSGQFLLDLLRFVRPLIRTSAPRRRTKDKPRAVVSLVIPDEQSAECLMELCLPMLLTDGSLAYLCGEREVTLLVWGRQPHLDELEVGLRKPMLDWKVVTQPLPDALSDRIEGDDLRRDWLVGALKWQHLTEARRLNAEFYSVMANGIYAAGYLKNVMKVAQGKPAVLTVPLWINNRGYLDREMGHELPTDPVIVSTRSLANLGRSVIGSDGCVTFVDGNNSLRGPTAQLRVMWAGNDRLDIHSTYHEILFLSADSVHAMPDRFFVRPGADLERLLNNQMPHFVAEADGIVVGEFGHPPGTLTDVAGDAARFEAVTGPLAQRACSAVFRQPVRLPISHNAEVAVVDVNSEPGRTLHGAFLMALDGMQSGPKVSQVLTALNVLHQYEMSEYGPANMAAALREARRLIDLSPTEKPALSGDERKVLVRAAMNFDYVDKAIALAKGGSENTSFVHEFLAKMMELRDDNTLMARQLRRSFFYRRSFAVVGTIVWGEDFTDKFTNYHLPSLLASGNIPAVARRRKVVHSIVTTETDRQRILASPIFKRLEECAKVVFTCFPKAFLAERERQQYPFYQFYGLLDHQNVFLATTLGAELYLLPPDIVLSHDSLSNLSRRLARGAAACSVAGVECDPDALRQWLDARSRGPAGELDLAAKEQFDFGIATPDAYARSLIMNADNDAFCAHPRELVWPHTDGISVHSIFMHPVAVSARLMRRSFSPQYENVDYALLPRLLRDDASLEVLDPCEMAIAQFGAPAAREEFLDSGFSLEAFVNAHRYNYAIHRRCFAKRQFFPCESSPYAPSNHHDTEAALIQAALRRYQFTLNGEQKH